MNSNFLETRELILFFLTVIGSTIAVISFIRVTYYQKKRYMIERSQYATDMIKDWNTNSAVDTNIVQVEFGNYYNNCQPIPLSDIKEKMKKDKNFRDSVKRLFNYFEYVATAYNTSADKDIIEKSFSLTIIRYVQMLENYLLFQLYHSKRNHWIPVTEFVNDQVQSKTFNCKFCDKPQSNQMDCFLLNSEYKALLHLFNKENFSKEERIKVENIFKARE